jgi:hypothetical protein
MTPASTDKTMLKARIEASILDGRRTRQIRGSDLHEGANAPRREQDPRGPAGERQRDAFGEELTDQAPAAGPRAERTAISAVRVVARASRRLDTLTHAMSSTKATAPKRISSGRWTVPIIESSSGTAATE